MKRFTTLVLLAAAVAVLGVTTSAHADSNSPYAAPSVATTFPAAGELTVDAVIVRSDPSGQAKKIKVMHYFRSDYRIQEILAVGSTTDANGVPWYKISVPMRPNGVYGWIPASAADLQPTVAEIDVNVARRTIDVYRHGKRVLHSVVAVGAPGMETPLGYYYVTVRFVPDNPFLGVFALETSAYSKLTEWPGGGVVGIHGTNEPWLLGKAVSHGCVRVSNATAAKLKRYAPLGTPIVIKG